MCIAVAVTGCSKPDTGPPTAPNAGRMLALVGDPDMGTMGGDVDMTMTTDTDMTMTGGDVDMTMTTDTDMSTCDPACAPGQVCSDGTCITPCGSGDIMCNGGCTDITSDPNNCGGCGIVCDSGFCTDSVCQPVCSNPQVQCGSGCTDITTDPNNCGACGNICPSGQCANAQCQGSCPPGQTLCASGCADLTNDSMNCGACGNVCPSGECQSGVCKPCDPGQIVCNDACSDTSQDPYNCGACGTACANGQQCVDGVCTGQPAIGWPDPWAPGQWCYDSSGNPIGPLCTQFFGTEVPQGQSALLDVNQSNVDTCADGTTPDIVIEQATGNFAVSGNYIFYTPPSDGGLPQGYVTDPEGNFLDWVDGGSYHLACADGSTSASTYFGVAVQPTMMTAVLRSPHNPVPLPQVAQCLYQMNGDEDQPFGLLVNRCTVTETITSTPPIGRAARYFGDGSTWGGTAGIAILAGSSINKSRTQACGALDPLRIAQGGQGNGAVYYEQFGPAGHLLTARVHLGYARFKMGTVNMAQTLLSWSKIVSGGLDGGLFSFNLAYGCKVDNTTILRRGG